MLYDYKCEECGYFMEDVYQSIKDECLTKCPSCNKESLNRVIYGGLGSFMKDTKTIGQLADKNWHKMGSYKRSEIEEKNKPAIEAKNKQKLLREINKMSAAQKKKFIITGEK